MHESELRAALRDVPLGGLRVFQRIGSTNDAALAWAREAGPDQALVVADEQTAGRGRSGRVWHTPPDKALAFSLLLRPTMEEASQASRLAGLGCLAVTDALGELGLSAAIKWPNDVLLNGRKVAGVLAESIWNGESLHAAVLGIGINVLLGSTPTSGTLFPATTIEAEMGTAPDRIKLLRACVSALLMWRGELSSDRFWVVWQDRLAYIGEMVVLTAGRQERQEAQLVGLESDGSLLLRTADGPLHVQAGDIHLRRSDDRIG
jgi:BirA family transcriptional regulator, biotin operon repressor / biotin---[acetyl-CoA-carboxylase] ligase